MLDEVPTRGQWRATVELRERLYALFASAIDGGALSASDEHWMLDRVASATRAASLERTHRGFVPAWIAHDAAALRHALVAEAATLLCSAGIDRVRACDGCGWLFLDTSRAGARRWCAMSMCGSRHKMRRYHQRRTVGAAR